MLLQDYKFATGKEFCHLSVHITTTVSLLISCTCEAGRSCREKTSSFAEQQKHLVMTLRQQFLLLKPELQHRDCLAVRFKIGRSRV